MVFLIPPMKTTSVTPRIYAATLPTPPVTVISASPPNKAAVTMLEEAMKTKLKSRLYFLNNPASCAIQGSDCDITRAECIPTSLSGADAP